MDKQPSDETTTDQTTRSPLGAEGESLEFSTPQASDTPVSAPSDPTVINATSSSKTSEDTRGSIRKLWDKINIYLLLFILLILLSLVVVAVIYFLNRSSSTQSTGTINQQQLSSEALDELATNGVQVGDPQQTLNIQSNSVFAGTVLVKGELQVAGGLQIGSGDLTIPDLTVGGSAVISQLQAQSLAVSGDVAVQGQISTQKSLSVNGTGTFNGAVTATQIIANQLQLSGDLSITRHLVAGGGIPNRTNGNILGAGGTSSLSGSDTSGSITISTGSGASIGCMATITFATAFASTPHVIVTPIGSAAASIDYYIDSSTTSFSICSASTIPSNQSFGFDYFVAG